MISLKKSVAVMLSAMAGVTVMAGNNASAQECYLGEVRMFAGNFSPRGWAPADGRLVPINQNQAVFSLLGCTYGGDCRTTFALPDLRGRAPVGVGQGPGLTNRELGEKFGVESVTPPTASYDLKPGDKPVALGTMPRNNTQPSIAIGYHICMSGVFPSRS